MQITTDIHGIVTYEAFTTEILNLLFLIELSDIAQNLSSATTTLTIRKYETEKITGICTNLDQNINLGYTKFTLTNEMLKTTLGKGNYTFEVVSDFGGTKLVAKRGLLSVR